MAGSTVLPFRLELPSTPVQEMIKCSKNQIPERYIFQPNKTSSISGANANGSDVPLMESPIIDLQRLSDPSSLHGKQELENLRSALSSWGCFQLVNHGLESSLLDQLREVCKEFFAQPAEEKQKYSRVADYFEGYGDDAVSEDKPIDWCDRLEVIIYPIQNRNLKLWPENVPNFRETLHEYAIGIRQVLEDMLKSIARSLNLEENSFYSHFEQDGLLFGRILFYPPCPSPEKVSGLRAHSDGTLITLLLQDKEVEGLQVLKDDQWFRVPILTNALFVNVGDLLEIMSNGILKSSVHKVVTNKEKQRISVAVTNTLHSEEEIGPLNEVINKGMPQLYKSVKYYHATYLDYYTRGERAIDTLKIEE